MSLLLRRRTLASAVNHPDDGRWCYAIGHDGQVLTSSDYGFNWVDRGDYNTAYYQNRVLVDNYGNGFFFLSNGNVYRSVRGATPEQLTGNVGKTYSPCMFTGSGFFASNAGTSWQTGFQATINQFTAGNTITSVTAASFNTWDQVADSASACSRDGKYVVFGGRQDFTNGFISRNGGGSWEETLATSSYGNGIGDVAMSADGKFTILLGFMNPNTIFSTDYLATFQVVTDRADSVDITADGKKAFIVGSTGVYQVDLKAGMTTMEYKKISSIGMRRIRCSANGRRLVGIGYSTEFSGPFVSDPGAGDIYMSKDGGNTWTNTKVGARDIKVYKHYR